jgi:pteridine reductase
MSLSSCHSSWTPNHETNQERLVRLFGCENPVAWITGSAADRVGRQIAKHFFSRGYRVVIHARHSIQEGVQGVEQLCDLRPNHAMLVTGAIEEDNFAERAIGEIKAKFERLDVLVNSAAIWDPVPLEQITAKELRRNFDANTIGSFLCAQQAGLLMVSQSHGGAIINIGDWASERPYSGFASYFPSKGSIPSLTKCMAVELSQRNPRIRVSAVLPGPVMIPNEMTPEARRDLLKQCLLQREGTAQDVAEAALFLAEAPFITGVCLAVDGGRTLFGTQSTDATAHPSHWID